ncbi:MAG: TraG family conjugative transposon ATPase [Rikenellaceae bacterium]
MRQTLRATTLQRKFPILSVENGCIVSKFADLTYAYRVELPEIFTLATSEYEAMQSAWVKALKTLPNYTVIHKQDWYVNEEYKATQQSSFLGNAYESHFAGRQHLRHECYIFFTKTTREHMRQQSNFTILCRGNIIPKEVNSESIARFKDQVEQSVSIINESSLVKLTPLTDDEITGTDNTAGIVEKYFSLSLTDTTTLEDISLGADELRIGDKRVCAHTISDVDDLPSTISTHARYERLSTDRSECLLSFAAPVGLHLKRNHIYNQYVFIDDPKDALHNFERTALNMNSLSRYSRANQINKEWIEEYLNEAHSQGLTSVRTHANIIAWSDEPRGQLTDIKNEVGSAIALMGCKPRHNTVDAPTLYWSAIPGNAADFPAEESLHTFLEQAVCLFTSETNYKSRPSAHSLKLADRLSGVPIDLDLTDAPMKLGVITNRNAVVIGGSGTGKSFFMCVKIRIAYEQGAHILTVDVGNSYSGLCEMIRKMTGGRDGIYFTYTEENPISFNPFFSDDYIFDVEKKDGLKTLLLTLWKSESEIVTKTESAELGSAVSAYLNMICEDRTITPNFNTFYEFMRDRYRKDLEDREIKVSREEFNIDNFLTTTRQYYRGGRYDFLLNSEANIDLLTKRFVVFEIDSIKDNKELFPVVTIIIMETFISKMRRLKGVRKVLIIEEAWKALNSPTMGDYIKYMYKTVRKYYGEAIVVTQEVDDIVSSPIVKDAIINNSDCKILLDQRKSINKFDAIQNLLGLSEKERAQILSINLANDPKRKYKEVWIGLGGKQSAVYATEVSMEEYLTYTTEESEKLEVQQRTALLGGDIEQAIKQLANEKRAV